MQHLTAFAWSGIIISSLCFLLLLLLISLSKGKTKFNYLLTFLTVPIGVWGIECIFIGTTLDPVEALLHWKIGHIGIIFIPPALFHFCATFIKNNYFRKFLIIFIYLIACVFLYFNLFTSFFLKNVSFMFNEFYYDAPPTLLYLFFILYFFLTIASCFVIAFSDFKEASFVQKTKIKYVFYGSVIASVGGSFNFLPLFGIDIYPILNFLLIFYPISVGYATLKYKLLDIDLAFREILKYIFIFVITFFASLQIIHFLQASLHISVQLTLDTVLFLIGFIIISRFLNYFLRTNQFFHKIFSVANFESFKQALKEFHDKDFFYKSVKDLERNLHYIFCEKWVIKESYICEVKCLKNFPKLLKYLQDNKKSFIRQELNNYVIDDGVDDMGDVFIPLFDWTGKTLVSVFILKKKQDDQFFSEQELNLIHRSIGHISLAYQILYYNKNLKAEIKQQTKQLNIKNKKLKASYQKLQKLDEAKDNFLSMASHELRTPMTVIKGYTDFLLSNDFGELNNKQSEFVHYIQNSSNGLLLLVNDMLDLSKIEAGRIEFEYEKVDLRQYFEKIFKGFEMQSKQQSINFTYFINSKLPKYIILDKQKIRSVLVNLIGNAFKFTPQKGNVTINIIQSEDMIQIEVRDTGIGIAEDDLEKVFEKFGQVNNYLSKDYKGTGLGLSIVKKILEKMNGNISLKSELKKGSIFTVKLPIILR